MREEHGNLPVGVPTEVGEYDRGPLPVGEVSEETPCVLTGEVGKRKVIDGWVV